MGGTRFVLLVVVALGLSVASAGCADGGEGRSRDSGSGFDASTSDSGGGGTDAQTIDTGPAEVDAGTDAGPRVTVGTCETCEVNEDCGDGSYCANLVTGGRACLPGCNPDIPSCPMRFTCIYDASGTGVDAFICGPLGGPCCVDEDGDGYGTGIGCMGADCNDMNEEVHPDREEICDGVDTNCNRTVDEPPTDCGSGRCTPDGDGTYSAIASGTCTAAECGMGTTTDCGLFTCSEGGDEGTTCATACAPAGTDDDTYCIASAHCDTGACIDDVPNGGMCDEDTDCGSAHCDNGFCCGEGTCCSEVADCPGGGAVTRICEDPDTCQGARGMTECNADSQCVTVDGIADDRGCDTATLARDCGLYDPIYCNGAEVQTGRACPTTCISDGDCIDAAHCTVGRCIPDLPPGGPCVRNQDCEDGLSCSDNVCCTSTCTGSCEACDLPGSAGTCVDVPAGADPDGECAGFSCSGYYDGFDGTTDECFRRSDVSDSAAVCNGAGACVGPDLVCPTQSRGARQVDCNDACQTPRGGTCTGTIAGVCDNDDDAAMRTYCGMGICQRDVQACVMGAPQMCTAGTPLPETCNGLDDDCNGTPDNGAAASICPAAAQASMVMCNGAAGCSITGCNSGWNDLDGSYVNGCECNVARGGVSCAVAHPLGSIAASGGSTTYTGAVPNGGERWFTVDFPISGRPGGRTPRIQLTGASAATHVLQVTRNCMSSSTFVCGVEGGTATSGSTTDFEFRDFSTVPMEAWASNPQAWPTTVYIRVTRLAAATTCAEAEFTLSITR